jgi:acetyl-CoA carboxylase biotin carboxylase subunit
MRLRRALDEFVVDGIETTLPLFRTLVRNQDIQNGLYDIHWLEKFLKDGGMGDLPGEAG